LRMVTHFDQLQEFSAETNPSLLLDLDLIRTPNFRIAPQSHLWKCGMAFTSRSNQENIRSWNSLPQINHIIAKNDHDLERRIVELLGSQVQGQTLSSLLPQTLTTFTLRSPNQMNEARGHLEKATTGITAFSEFTRITQTVASELLLNSFYHAPIDEVTGKPRNRLSQKNFSLGPNEAIQLNYGKDREYFWIAVTDPFGSLTKEKLLSCLTRCTATERCQIREGDSGAGVGLYMVYNWASEMFFSIEPNAETTVACKILIAKRNRDFHRHATGVHVFWCTK
jgi:hypothetical protein